MFGNWAHYENPLRLQRKKWTKENLNESYQSVCEIINQFHSSIWLLRLKSHFGNTGAIRKNDTNLPNRLLLFKKKHYTILTHHHHFLNLSFRFNIFWNMYFKTTGLMRMHEMALLFDLPYFLNSIIQKLFKKKFLISDSDVVAIDRFAGFAQFSMRNDQ